MRTIQKRFEEKFVRGRGDECWEWIAHKNNDGYGCFGFDGKVEGAHRIAYQLYVGEIPEGLCVCHRCDNPSCVRPDHLFLGTQADNMHDRDNKGRGVFPDNSGENQWRSKFTNENVKTIRILHANGARNVDLAKQFGGSPQNISRIVCGRRWTKILLEEEP